MTKLQVQEEQAKEIRFAIGSFKLGFLNYSIVGSMLQNKKNKKN